MAACPKCKQYFRTPEDERDMNDCPKCGYWERIPFEPDDCPNGCGELLEGGGKMVWYDDFGRMEPSVKHCPDCGYEEEII